MTIDARSPEGRIPAPEALALLRAGNERFAANVRSVEALQSGLMRAEHAGRQQPFAIVLACSDSRVPVEILFDQGLGTLFVIRVAGNIVAPSQIGSIEYAAERFGTRLVVVLGHSQCGAVGATLEALSAPRGPSSRNQLSIVSRIRPAVDSVMSANRDLDAPRLWRECVRANVRMAVAHLRQGSMLLEQLILEDGMLIVGAEYDLVTGKVDFFEGV
ncbi:MAG TPA: carbonic anhydrase [Polyangiaceae bacterium]|nr:carbonic anhydrase [Polyangiaceae bacterium]